MRYLVVVLCALLASCAGTMQPLILQGSVPVTDPKVNVYFDSTICNLKKNEMIIYPGNGLGISYNYEKDKIIGTYYVYNNNQNAIEDGCISNIVKSDFSQCLQQLYMMQQYGKYQNVIIENQTNDKITINNTEICALFAKCKMIRNDIPYASYVLVTGYKNQIFKIRYSFPMAISEEANQYWDCMLNSLGDSTFVKNHKQVY